MKKNTTGSLDFNGQNNSEKHGGYSKKYQTNASGRTASENYGRGPTKAGVTGDHAGPSTAAGKSVGSRSWEPKAGQNYVGNPDKQNEGRGPTKGNCGDCK